MGTSTNVIKDDRSILVVHDDTCTTEYLGILACSIHHAVFAVCEMVHNDSRILGSTPVSYVARMFQ